MFDADFNRACTGRHRYEIAAAQLQGPVAPVFKICNEMPFPEHAQEVMLCLISVAGKHSPCVCTLTGLVMDAGRFDGVHSRCKDAS